jgi:hypothetical protein
MIKSKRKIKTLPAGRHGAGLDGIGSETYAAQMNFPLVDSVTIHIETDSKKPL